MAGVSRQFDHREFLTIVQSLDIENILNMTIVYKDLMHLIHSRL
jgi:hypothetical protein